MVGKITSGQSFGQLGWYLSKKDPGRVAWTAARNTSERDPVAIASEMQDVAAGSSRIEKPVYHVSISLDPGDELSREQLEQVADQTLKDLGLDEHQAAFVAHNDTDHTHVHLMVNRVHPGTQKAWDMWKDRDRLKASLERQERELGIRLTGNNVRRPAPDRQPTRSIGEVKEAERRGGKPFADEVREEALPEFREASSWGDLERRLEKRGLALVGGRKRGGVVTDGQRYAKLSKVSRSISRTKLDQRFGSTYTDHKRRSDDMAQKTQATHQRPKEVEEFSGTFRGKLESARKDVERAETREELREGLERNGLTVETSENGRRAEVVNRSDPSERISVRDLNSAYRKDGRLASEREMSDRDAPEHEGADIGGDGAANVAAERGQGAAGTTLETGKVSSSERRGGAVRAAGEVTREVIEPMEEESDAMKKAARLAATLGRLADRARRQQATRTQRRSERGSGAEIDEDAEAAAENVAEADAEMSKVDRAEAAITEHQERRDLERDHAELNQKVEEAKAELRTIEHSEANIENARRDVGGGIGEATSDIASDQAREMAQTQGAQGVREAAQDAKEQVKGGGVKDSLEEAQNAAQEIREETKRPGPVEILKESERAAQEAEERSRIDKERVEQSERLSPEGENPKEALRARIEEGEGELSRMEDEIGAAGADESRQKVGRRVADLNEQEIEELKERAGAEQMRGAERAAQTWREDRTREDIRAHEEVKGMERDRRASMKTVTEGEKRLSEDNRIQEKLDRSTEEFRANLKEAYQDPAQAEKAYNEKVEKTSAAEASKDMRRNPESFGALNQTEKRSGIFSTTKTDEPAREAASVAANRSKVSAQLRQRAMSDDARGALKKEVSEARSNSRKLTKALEQRASTKSLKQQIGHRMNKMSAKGRTSFTKSLGAKGKAIAKSGMAAVGVGAVNATADKEHGASL